MGIHSGRRPHKCNICKVTFVEKLSLSHHMHGHQRAELRQSKSVKKHSNTVTEGPSIHIEEQISKHFIHTSSDLADNIHSQTEDRTSGEVESPVDRNINTDSRRLSSSGNDNWRVKTNQSDKPSQNSGRDVHLKHTVSTQVADKKFYKCQLCDRNCRTSSALLCHKRVHTGEKTYKCKVCEQSFTQSSNLTCYMLRHTGEKPYKCKVCEKHFPKSYNLTRHMLRHTGEKPYKCKVCEKSFTNSYNLTRHMLRHTGEKPYKCKLCEQSFAQSHHLTGHVLIHTGERPFKCTLCDLCFRLKSTLTSHALIHAGKNQFKCLKCDKYF